MTVRLQKEDIFCEAKSSLQSKTKRLLTLFVRRLVFSDTDAAKFLRIAHATLRRVHDPFDQSILRDALIPWQSVPALLHYREGVRVLFRPQWRLLIRA